MTLLTRIKIKITIINMTQDPLYTEDYTKLPQKIPLSPTLSLLSLSLSFHFRFTPPSLPELMRATFSYLPCPLSLMCLPRSLLFLA
jgi:hypothetical protein